MPTSDELGGQTFSGFQEHSFEAATVQETPLYSVVNLRIKLAVTFPSPNQAILRLVFFSYKKKNKYQDLEHLDSFYAELLNITLSQGKPY